MADDLAKIKTAPGSAQFGKSTTYRSPDDKGHKQSAYVGGVVVAILLVVALFRTAPDQAPGEQSPIPAPEPNYDQSQTIQFPTYSYLKDQPQASRDGAQGGGGSGTSSKTTLYAGPKLIARPSINEVPPGSIVKAVLLTGASNGPVRAETTEALVVNGETVLPEKVLFLGTGQSTEEGLVVQFDKLVFKDGASQSIQAKALDFEDKMPRLKGSRVGYYGMKLAAGIGLNFAAGLAEGLQEKETNGQVVISKPTVKNALLNGASTAALDLSQETLSNVKNKPPVFEIKSATPIFITFN